MPWLLLPLRQSRAVALKDAGKVAARIASGDLGNLLGRAVGHDGTAAVAALGAKVEHAVGHLDDVEVVLDDKDGVASVNQTLEHVDELPNVLEVQACGGLVQDVEGLARLLAVQLLRKLHALRLAARERGGALAQVDVAQPHVMQGLQLVLDARDVGEEGQGLVHGHVQHVRDGLAVVGDLERLPVVALAVADLAGHVDVG